jgi:hypothetical protein
VPILPHALGADLGESRLAGGYHRGLDPRRDGVLIVELALSTSDFPNLLANAGNKVLLPGYVWNRSEWIKD